MVKIAQRAEERLERNHGATVQRRNLSREVNSTLRVRADSASSGRSLFERRLPCWPTSPPSALFMYTR